MGIGRRRPVIERGVRPLGLVVGDPGSDDLPSPIEIEKRAFVEMLVTHAAIEGFEISVLHGPAGGDVMPFDLVLFASSHSLGAVVRADHLRRATPYDEGRKLAGNSLAGDRSVRHRG